MWSLFNSTIEQCEVCSIGDYYWTMWSLFSSTVEQCEVRSIVQSLDSLEWIQFQISAPPSSIFIARIWTRMRMRWSIGPMMLVTRITNTSGAMGTTRETGLVWDIFTCQIPSTSSAFFLHCLLYNLPPFTTFLTIWLNQQKVWELLAKRLIVKYCSLQRQKLHALCFEAILFHNSWCYKQGTTLA